MHIFIALIVFYIALSISLYFVFSKTGKAGWKGLVPGLNFVVWCDLIGRTRYHALWLLFPIVNIFIFASMAIDMVQSFRKYSFWHSVAAVIFTPIIFTYLGLNDNASYDGPNVTKERAYKEQLEEARKNNQTRLFKKLQANNPYRKSVTREWAEAIIFAVFAAAFIRMFLIEAYKIPTPSMEGSLLVGDFLFVSKAHYGIRTPMTPLMIPLLHNRIPLIGGESYLEKPDLPYYRLPALESIDRNEPIVFNWPVGDSVYLTPARSFFVDQKKWNPEIARYIGNSKLITRPIDKKDHYIKRCIAAPGDTLEIRNQQVYINGKAAENPENLQFAYRVRSKTRMNQNKLSEFGVNINDHPDPSDMNSFYLSSSQVEKIKNMGPDINVIPVAYNVPHVRYFPHDMAHFGTWSNDNYGPIWIPKKGETVTLTPENIALYTRIINVYENNTYERQGDTFLINGEPATTYTFKQDYYWAMGDNRHNSEDSRIWGFVPHDHIVGKPLFIWFSSNNGIRWNRIFTSAYKMD